MNNELFETPLSTLFLSDKNIGALHKAIQYRIHRDHDVTIGRQSTSELIIIMRGIFMNHAKNLPTDIVGQVQCLNKLVIDYSVSQIMTQVKQYIGFQHDQNNLPVPIMMPKSSNVKGENSLLGRAFI